MTEETDLTTETPELDEETSEQESLVTALAPIAMIAGVVAGAVYLTRKYVRLSKKDEETEVTDIIETNSTET